MILLKLQHKPSQRMSNSISVFNYKLIMLTIVLLIIQSQSQFPTCQINPDCFDGCSDSYCVYDPLHNPFYNPNLPTNTTNYNGPDCCNGCNSGYFLWTDSKTCAETCNIVNGVTTFGNPLTRTCDFACPNPYFGDIQTTKCIIKCSNDTWTSINPNLCVAICPSETSFHYVVNKTCLNTCPDGNFTYYGSNLRKYCGPQCPERTFGNKNSEICVNQCPNNTFAQPQTKLCQQKCFGLFPYGNTKENVCVSTCPYDALLKKQTFAQNITSTCVYDCPQGSYAHLDLKTCVQECYGNYSFANQTSKTCQASDESLIPIKKSNILFIGIGAGLTGLAALVFGTAMMYKFYVKKRLVRKPWKYDIVNDIHFTL